MSYVLSVLHFFYIGWAVGNSSSVPLISRDPGNRELQGDLKSQYSVCVCVCVLDVFAKLRWDICHHLS